MGTLASLFGPVLSYVDKPWKVIALIALLVSGVIVYTTYEQRAVIATTILRHYTQQHLLPEVYKTLAPELLIKSKADVTQLVAVDLEENQFHSISGFARDGSVWLPNVSPHPIFRETINPKVIHALIQSVPFCGDVTPAIRVLRDEYAAGVRRICLVGVPPVIGRVAGLLYVGWLEAGTPHDSTDEDSAKLALLATATEISSN